MQAFSLGHSNRVFSTFLQKLQENRIELVVDVRSYPRSRFSPQFNRKAMEQELANNGIKYSFKGNNLGGLDENIDYEKTVDELADMSRDLNICLVCSEGKYQDCHRYTMLTPSFEERGVKITHIEYD